MTDIELVEDSPIPVQPGLMERLIRKGARIKELELVTGIQAFRRDGQLMARRDNAIQKLLIEKMGGKMKAGGEDENVFIGENVTVGNRSNTLLPLLASMLVGGGLVGAAGWALTQYMSKDQPAVTQPVEFTDTDTRNTLRFED